MISFLCNDFSHSCLQIMLDAFTVARNYTMMFICPCYDSTGTRTIFCWSPHPPVLPSTHSESVQNTLPLMLMGQVVQTPRYKVACSLRGPHLLLAGFHHTRRTLPTMPASGSRLLIHGQKKRKESAQGKQSRPKKLTQSLPVPRPGLQR
jgi:hypothetical protein